MTCRLLFADMQNMASVLRLLKKQELFPITLDFCCVVKNDNVSVYIKFQIVLINIEDSPQIRTFTIENE